MPSDYGAQKRRAKFGGSMKKLFDLASNAFNNEKKTPKKSELQCRSIKRFLCEQTPQLRVFDRVGSSKHFFVEKNRAKDSQAKPLLSGTTKMC
jgi:hypothetical protein